MPSRPSILLLLAASLTGCGTKTDDTACETSLYWLDADGDSYGSPAEPVYACTQPEGYVAVADDCSDADATVNPDAAEVCNGLDDNCDLTVDDGFELSRYADGDGDGYGNPGTLQSTCDMPKGSVHDHTDCADDNAAVSPAATEVCNGIDDNCDGQADEGVQTVWYRDGDGDGFGDEGVQSLFHEDHDGDGYGDTPHTVSACSAPDGYVSDGTDCDDDAVLIHPGATEVCNNFDDDCDGSIDEGLLSLYHLDADGDGYGDSPHTSAACTSPEGYVADGTDCNDEDPLMNPGEVEVCDSLDNDCNGVVDDGVCQPVLTFTMPNDGATGVSLTIRPVAAFDVPMDGTTFTSATYTLTDGMHDILGDVSWSAGDQSAMFAPAAPLAPATEYWATIHSEVADTESVQFGIDYTWSFTTSP